MSTIHCRSLCYMESNNNKQYRYVSDKVEKVSQSESVYKIKKHSTILQELLLIWIQMFHLYNTIKIKRNHIVKTVLLFKLQNHKNGDGSDISDSFNHHCIFDTLYSGI